MVRLKEYSPDILYDETENVEPIRRSFKEKTRPYRRPVDPNRLPQMNIKGVMFIAFLGETRVTTDLRDDLAPEVAITDLRFKSGESILVTSTQHGLLGLAIGAANPASRVMIVANDQSKLDNLERSIEASSEGLGVLHNTDCLSRDKLENTTAYRQRYDTVVFQPPDHEGMEVIRRTMRQYLTCLKDGGRMVVITHKKSGSKGIREMLAHASGQEVDQTYQGRGGYRIFECIRDIYRELNDVSTPVNQVDVCIWDQTLTFMTEPGLFSTKGFDAGTKILLETIGSPRLTTSKRVLDVGCGWGVIGLIASLVNTTAEITMMDPEPRALAMAQRNAEALGVSDRTITVCDMANVDGRFDTVVSNPPFHLSPASLISLFSKVSKKMKTGASFFFVVEASYAAKFENVCIATMGSSRRINEVTSSSNGSTYYVYRCHK